MGLNVSLANLESAGLIRLAASEPEHEFLFRHTLIQEAAYESMLKQDRRRLHRAVGEALERLYPDRREELNGLLAFHYSRAELWAVAFDHARAAAARARRLYAMLEALGYYDLADDALAHSGRARSVERFDLLAERHGVSTVLGQLERSRADLSAMATLARELGDDARLAAALTGLGELFFTTGPLDQARAVLEDSVAVKRRLNDPRGLADSLNNLSVLYCGLGQLAQGQMTHAEGHRLYQALGDPDGLSRGEWTAGAIRFNFISDYEPALAHLQRAVLYCRQSGNRTLEAGSLLLIGAAHIRLGDYASGFAPLDQALGMAQAVGDRPAEGWAWLYLSWVDLEQGRFETGAARARLALDIAGAAGEKYLAWYACFTLARLGLAQGRPTEALAAAEKAYTLVQGGAFWPLTLIWSLCSLARASAALGRDEAAATWAGQALAELRAVGGQGAPEVQGVYFDCSLALRPSDPSAAQALLEQARAVLLTHAGWISDSAHRNTYLTLVATNRAITEESAAIARVIL